jgi:REP element-mobilizing transposase RayT
MVINSTSTSTFLKNDARIGLSIVTNRKTPGGNQMRTPYTQLYAHIIWSTWDRVPLITTEIQSRLYAAMADKCRRLKCEPLAISGTEDHVHLLVRLHRTTAISTLDKEVKGTSLHLVTHKITPGEFFKW